MKTLEFYHVLQKYLSEGEFNPNCNRRMRSDVRRACDKFTIKDGRLYYVGPNKTYMRLVVMTEEEKKLALNECHDNNETGNHHGVKSCERCQSNTSKTGTPVLHAVKKLLPVTVLVTHAHTAEEVCTSTDLGREEEDVQQGSRLPVVSTIDGATSSGEIGSYFQVVQGNVRTLLAPPLAQHLLGNRNNEQSTQTSHAPHATTTTTEQEADVNHIYKRYLLQELEVRRADLQYTKLKIRKLELEIKKMEKDAEQDH